MTRKSETTLLLVATTLAGLLAGFFYTWSFTIMQSLDLIDGSAASSAMQSINTNIRSGWFAATFFGTPVLIMASLIYTLLNNKRRVLWAGLALLFAIGTLAITFTQHIPLNNALADGLAWAEYSPQWVTWNHARMITSLLAFLSMIACLLTRPAE